MSYVVSTNNNTSGMIGGIANTATLAHALNSIGTETLSHAASMNFRIHKAVGGFVVEVTNYNNSQEYLPKSKLYVADENNLGSQIEKIFLLESIKS